MLLRGTGIAQLVGTVLIRVELNFRGCPHSCTKAHVHIVDIGGTEGRARSFARGAQIVKRDLSTYRFKVVVVLEAPNLGHRAFVKGFAYFKTSGVKVGIARVLVRNARGSRILEDVASEIFFLRRALIEIVRTLLRFVRDVERSIASFRVNGILPLHCQVEQ